MSGERGCSTAAAAAAAHPTLVLEHRDQRRMRVRDNSERLFKSPHSCFHCCCLLLHASGAHTSCVRHVSSKSARQSVRCTAAAAGDARCTGDRCASLVRRTTCANASRSRMQTAREARVMESESKRRAAVRLKRLLIEVRRSTCHAFAHRVCALLLRRRDATQAST